MYLLNLETGILSYSVYCSVVNAKPMAYAPFMAFGLRSFFARFRSMFVHSTVVV